MKTVRFIGNVFVGLIAVIVLLLVISVLPITGTVKFLTVLSGSMEPTIGTGSVVVVKPASSYAAGDVLTFRLSGEKTPVTHRIYEVRERGGAPEYITKGDANDGPDMAPVALSAVMGKVLFHVPFLGYAVDFVQRPAGFFLLILIPAIAIIYGEAGKIWREARRIRTERRTMKEQTDANKTD